MSYNGVGLQTPRGSGTNGHISKNLSSIRTREPYSTSHVVSTQQFETKRRPDLSILQHEAKRQIENRVLIQRTELEEIIPALQEEAIQVRLKSYREKIESEAFDTLLSERSRIQHKSYQTHDLAVSKSAEMNTLRSALGIRPDYEEGTAMKRQKHSSPEGTIMKRVYRPSDDHSVNPLDRRRQQRPRSQSRYERDLYTQADRRGHGVQSRSARNPSNDRWRHNRREFKDDSHIGDRKVHRSGRAQIRSRSRRRRRSRSRSPSIAHRSSGRRDRQYSRSTSNDRPNAERHRSSSSETRGRPRALRHKEQDAKVRVDRSISARSSASADVVKQAPESSDKFPAKIETTGEPILAIFDRRKALGIDQ